MAQKLETLFVGDINSPNLVTIQNWCCHPLDKMRFLDSYEEIANHRNKIVIVDAREANYKIDVTKKIAENGNYFVLMEIGEVYSFDTEGLINDLPVMSQFPIIFGGISDRYYLEDGTEVVESNRKKDFNLDSFYFLTHTDTNILKSTELTTSQYLEKKSKPYKFLFLNGRHRPHRKALWKALDQKNLLRESLKSYLGFANKKDVFYDNDIPMTVLPEKYESLYAGIDSIPAYKNDDRNWKVFKHDFWRRQWVDSHIIPDQYIDTYFTVVTETWCDRVFLTEKTFKPLMAGHPFLVLAAPGFYEYLHELGFKTFDCIIDESFAYERNLDKKISMLADEIERLCNTDLDDFVEKTRSICQHNQNHYINGRQKFFLEKHQKLQEFFSAVAEDACHYFQKQIGDNHGSV